MPWNWACGWSTTSTRPTYRCAHFHPADFGGMLVSFDQQRTTSDYLDPYGDWYPAGQDWRKTRTETVLDVTGLSLATADPHALAERWSQLIDAPLDPADPLRLPLERGEIHFEKSDRPMTWIQRIDLKVANPKAALDRAKAAGLDVNKDGVLLGGVRFHPVA